MEDYPKKVYLCASWQGLTKQLEEYVVQFVANKGYTLLGDWKPHDQKNNRKKGRGLNWQQRTDEILNDCGGCIAVMPLDKVLTQTTSPYFFPEIFSAVRRGIPICMILTPGISTEIETTGDGRTILWFPKRSECEEEWLSVEPFKWPVAKEDDGSLLPIENKESDDSLKSVHAIDISNCQDSFQIIEWGGQENDKNIEDCIERFLLTLDNRKEKYAFHALPFARKRTHQIIAEVVFRETGFPCFIASDNLEPPAHAREHWEDLISNAELMLVDLSGSNRNCIYEAGVGTGRNKPLQLLRQGKEEKGKVNLPFGLDDNLVKSYKNRESLADAVSQFCLPYKRTIWNIAKQSTADNSQPIPGTPKWLTSGSRQKVSSGNELLGTVLLGILFLVLGSFLIYRYNAGYLQYFVLLIGSPILGVVAIARLIDAIKVELNSAFLASKRKIRTGLIVAISLLILANGLQEINKYFPLKEVFRANESGSIDRSRKAIKSSQTDAG